MARRKGMSQQNIQILSLIKLQRWSQQQYKNSVKYTIKDMNIRSKI